MLLARLGGEFGFVNRRYLGAAGAFQAKGFGFIGDDGQHTSRQLTGGAGVEDGLQVGAIAGNQHDDAGFRWTCRGIGGKAHINVTFFSPLTSSTITNVSSGKPACKAGTSSGAATITMPIPMLKTRYISSGSTSPRCWII